MELDHTHVMKHQDKVARKYDALQLLTPVSANKHWVAGRNRHLSGQDGRKARSGLGALSRGYQASASAAGRQAFPTSTAVRPTAKSGAEPFARGRAENGKEQSDGQKRVFLMAGDFPAFDGPVDFGEFEDAVEDDGRAASLMVRLNSLSKARPKTTKGSALAARRMQL